MAFFFVLSSLFAVDILAAGKILVRVPAGCSVTGDRLTLGEIAVVEGDEESRERLRAIPLGYAPAVGATKQITRERLAMAISAAGFVTGEIELIAPQTVTISRSSKRIGRDEFEEALERTLLGPMRAYGTVVRLLRLDAPGSIAVPVGSVEISASASGVSNIFAPFSVAMEIRVDGKVFRRIAMNAEIEVSTEVYVASRDIPVNSKINIESLQIESRRISKPLTSYLKKGDPLKGLIAIRNLKAGDELTTDAIISGIVIRSGDPVRIVGRSGSLQLTVNGIAKASGRIGERIPVANAESKLILQAIVSDEGLVRVSF